MIVSAAVLMRERGVQATSFSEVIERSGAPRGSIYHHFPGGKAQLIEAATRYAGEFTAAGLLAALQSADPPRAVHEFARTWTEILRQSDFGAGCPVVAATLEGDRSPGAREAAGAAFAQWESLIGRALSPHTTPARARSIATLFITAIEGAVIIARAQRSTAPLQRVAAELEHTLRQAIADGPSARTAPAHFETEA
jgi:TetR/AcrR family transcriptional regulator, lmrAB and yxaGH operons repressor